MSGKNDIYFSLKKEIRELEHQIISFFAQISAISKNHSNPGYINYLNTGHIQMVTVFDFRAHLITTGSPAAHNSNSYFNLDRFMPEKCIGC